MHTRLNRIVKATSTALLLFTNTPGIAQDLSLGFPSARTKEVAQVATTKLGGDVSDSTTNSESQGLSDELADESPATEIINERYPSGNVKVRREVTQDADGNYVLHGEWTMWDEKGNPIAQGTYQNHQRQGLWTRWHRARNEAKLFAQLPYSEFEPPFKSQVNFENGQLHGTWIFTDSRNRKISEWNFTNGQRNGACTWYHPSGHKLEEVTYRNGLLDGHRYQWDKSAKLIVDEIYIEGRQSAPRTDYHEPGQKKTEGMYLHAQYVLDMADDWWNAVPATYRAVGQDVRHGSWVSYHPNGRKKQEGRFENDVEVGEFTWWYENGQMMTKGSWQDGKRQGLWIWYHENGQKSVQGEFLSGEPAGPWSYWKTDGHLYQKADFSERDQAIVTTPDSEQDDENEVSAENGNEIPSADL